MTIRTPQTADKPALMALAEATGLFSPEELGGMDHMMTTYFAGEAEPGHFWIVDDAGPQEGGIRGAAYCGPESFAGPGVWNLYFIGVYPDDQNAGRGSKMLHHIEDKLRVDGQRLLLIDTSSGEGFGLTRAFYRKHGYDEEARIRGFYGAEDKVTFRKELTE
ncbi:GNAT family N-acetyltransferase [Sulfitobacter sp. S190]|uniref:GNAT family N-acetyltransferase n=1 Tax=Sulfitobacter sp. S190 TaxID=2867022 RepID=UPI0021A7F143|nr:GNAT family N-acetyltransferase [Sulfitobacter sp. S190]UWR22594.1 GNAT family N-acetyltransferase [Sulfitobacter sp. S190]